VRNEGNFSEENFHRPKYTAFPFCSEVWWSVAKCCSVVMVLVIRGQMLLENIYRQYAVAAYMYFTIIRFVHILWVLLFVNVYMVLFLFNNIIYVFLLLCLCVLIVCLCIFIVPGGTPRLPWLRFFRGFSSVVRQIPGYNPQRRGTARTLPKFLCCSI